MSNRRNRTGDRPRKGPGKAPDDRLRWARPLGFLLLAFVIFFCVRLAFIAQFPTVMDWIWSAGMAIAATMAEEWGARRRRRTA
ncbi:hypothetical protein FHS95_000045 [Sphingomonas naasensis]|uniref:Uncharacterized protein n=1 Tax=Sphingomonas naasensis TaxID=1344951 RepID=A0A4S1WSG3_9SPHN|nr:hypothetical protein [Sphingomonas naasensis]NIJ18376.1 hypothetical protein [Sphingomonas naasensis]TGX45645.1 hypothetical protein E5A74_00225 [Sphingomonas naasensis]